MTYNFDPDQWYAREAEYLGARRRAGALDEAGYEAAMDDLERRYEAMLDRLDGTYRLPHGPEHKNAHGR